jgi:Putative zinc-finger
MSCTAWQDSLTERLYGEIGREDDVRLTSHLESCASCRETLDAFQRVRNLMREDEPDVRRVPRVVVLRDRFRFRPALMAASLMGTVVLAGLGAGAGYALGVGRAPGVGTRGDAARIETAASTEELVRREVGRRLDALRESKMNGADSMSGAASPTPAAEHAVNQSELRAEFAKFERRLNGTRAADLDYVLDQIAASEFRVGTRLGKTNQALRSVALANTPYANEQ